MSVSFNKVILAGNVTRDPELRHTPNNTPVTDITLAINRQFKCKEETTFVDVTLWSRLAEITSEYVKKGHPILVEGRLQLDTWENNEGEKRSKMKVIAERMQMLSTKNGVNSDTDKEKASDNASDDSDSDDDIPF